MTSTQCGLIDSDGIDCCATYCEKCAQWQVTQLPEYEYYEYEISQRAPFVCENCGIEYNS